MGRPIGSPNREKAFNAALRVALQGDPLRLRRIAEKLATLAENGDLAAIRELADRLDGKPAQIIDRDDAPIRELTDAELHLSPGRLAERPNVLLIPPAPKGKI